MCSTGGGAQPARRWASAHVRMYLPLPFDSQCSLHVQVARRVLGHQVRWLREVWKRKKLSVSSPEKNSVRVLIDGPGRWQRRARCSVLRACVYIHMYIHMRIAPPPKEAGPLQASPVDGRDREVGSRNRRRRQDPGGGRGGHPAAAGVLVQWNQPRTVDTDGIDGGQAERAQKKKGKKKERCHKLANGPGRLTRRFGSRAAGAVSPPTLAGEYKEIGDG